MKQQDFILKLLAWKFANLMYKPSGFTRPSRKAVMEHTSKDVGLDLCTIYSTWEKETFLLNNDGIDIPAEYHPVANAKGIAILAHGFGQNRYAMLPQAKIFRDMGYSTVLFDQRHFGESKAPNSTFGIKEASDIVALAEWSRKRHGNNSRIVVLGVSMGAMALMHALAVTDQIDAAIEDCGPAEMETVLDTLHRSVFGFSNQFLEDTVRKISASYGVPSDRNKPVEGVAQSRIPLLVIHGEADSAVDVKQATEIYAASKNPISRMKTFPGREHAFSVQDADLYRKTIEEFLRDIFENNDKECTK